MHLLKECTGFMVWDFGIIFKVVPQTLLNLTLNHYYKYTLKS